MLFNSYVFILLFLPITLIGYYLFNKFGGRHGNTVSKIWLLAASLFFYGYFNWSYLAIILISIGINYGLSGIMLKSDKQWLRKTAFIAGIVLNIGCLLYYKYLDFFIENINAIFKTSFMLTGVLLPLGISFFTFQQLSYVIDSYKKNVPMYNILDYSLFVTFFPQLIAGPIVLHDEIVPQFADKNNQRFNYENFGKGIMAFSMGLAKKVLLADAFGVIANWGFSNISSLGTVNAVIVIVGYTLQMYLDFSGYSDMAIGLGYMFNIKLPINFNSPYKTVTIIDYWKNWHITLSRFFTTYIYIPLGGNRKGYFRTLLNVFIVFAVSGIWHGANWTFILWGCTHGIAQIICKVLKLKKTDNKLKNAVLWFVNFAFITLAFVIFRADSLGDAWAFYGQFFNFRGFNVDTNILSAFQFYEFKAVLQLVPSIGNVVLKLLTPLAFVVTFAGILTLKNTKTIADNFSEPKWYHAVFCTVLLVWSVISFSGVSTFLYWNF